MQGRGVEAFHNPRGRREQMLGQPNEASRLRWFRWRGS